MGFWHEQTRIDRDNFVTVDWSNIQMNAKPNFFKNEDPANDLPLCDLNDGSTTFDNCDQGWPGETFGLPYDYQSIMHYGDSL